MELLIEGIESITLACSLVVLLPTLALVLTSTNRVAILAGSIMGTSTMMWAIAGGLWDFGAGGPTALFIAAVIIGVFFAGRTAGAGNRRAGLAVGFAGGVVAGWLWRPCVGSHLATVLNEAEAHRLRTLLEMQLYVTALCLPLIVFVALRYAWPRITGIVEHRLMRTSGFVVGLAYAFTVAVGRFDDLVGELFRISSN